MTIDIVGSFLPPETLVNARRNFETGAIDQELLSTIENEVIANLVSRQLEAGLKEVTSGELRRTHWDLDFYFGLEGISKELITAGRIYQDVEAGEDLVRVTGRIAYNPAHPFFEDFLFLAKSAGNSTICRQTLPSPTSLFLDLIDLSDGHTEKIYPSSETLASDIAEAYNKTILHFYELGCRSIQFDDTAFGRLCMTSYSTRLLQGGVNLIALHDTLIDLLNKSLVNIPSDMKVSLYISGGDPVVPEWQYIEYPDNIMPKVLSRANVSKFFLPFEPGNSYQTEILRHVPKGKEVVLGVIDAHSPFPDKTDHIRTEVLLAERHIDPSLLSLSPKTGFKLTSYARRGLTYEDQWHKLDRLKRI